jgi:hypothetical protein
MSVELDRPGMGLAAFTLSVSALLALKRNGTLADYELSDIVEQALAKLKALDPGEGVRSQAALEAARYFLEQLHAHLAHDPIREQVGATRSPRGQISDAERN